MRLKSFAVLSCVLFYLLTPLVVRAASPTLVISEIQTGSATNSGQEFVELYNPTDADVEVDGWILQYKSATSAIAESSWTKRAELKGTVKAHGFYLVSQKTYLTQADADLSTSGLAGVGGHVRLKDKDGNLVDLVGWGTANFAETSPAAAPAAGQSIERLPGRLQELAGNSTDSDDNSKDFVLRDTPMPQSSVSDVEIPGTVTPSPLSDPTDVPGSDETTVTTPVTYLPVLITEVLPDPAAPLTDASDEFIELYNPNDTAVNLAGYTLRTGSDFHDFYNLPDGSIDPGGYLVIYSRDSHLALTNSGGAAELLDPAGNEVARTGVYPAAISGASWALFDNDWRWTLQTTPAADNILVAPAVAQTAPKSTKSVIKKTAAPAKPKTTKVAAVKTTKPKSTKKTVAAKTALAAVVKKDGPVGWLLIGLAMLSIGYALYEFRHDLRNYYHITRKNLRARRTTR